MPHIPLPKSVLIWIAALGISTGGCSSGGALSQSNGAGAASGSHTAAAGGSGSGTGGSGTGTNGGSVAPTCEQGCQDYLVATGLNRVIWFLWNQKIAGHPVGAYDVTAACPLGGTVHITGTDSASDTGITSTVMTFELAACEDSASSYDRSFTGVVTMDGSFDSSTDFAALTFTASSLTVSGAVHYYDDPVIDDACDTNLTQQGMGSTFEMNGQRCGRPINESLLDPGSAGSGGNGGSNQGGSAGSSTTDCTCLCSDGRNCTGATDPNPCGVDADGIPDPCACPVECP